MVSQFALAFREHVTPRLRRACYVQGVLLQLDLVEFSEAFDAVWQIARSRGAMHLPEEHFRSLREWIDTELLTQAETPLAPTSPNDCESAARQSGDPERMRWALAAALPDYRAALLAHRKASVHA